jgi:hypothetical protein
MFIWSSCFSRIRSKVCDDGSVTRLLCVATRINIMWVCGLEWICLLIAHFYPCKDNYYYFPYCNSSCGINLGVVLLRSSIQPNSATARLQLKVNSSVKVKVILRLTISQPVSLGIEHPPGGPWPDIYCSSTVTVLFLWGALSDERMSLSYVHAAGTCQRSLYQVRVPWDSPPYFTVSHSRLPFSSPPTTRRVTVEVFDHLVHSSPLYMPYADRFQNTVLNSSVLPLSSNHLLLSFVSRETCLLFFQFLCDDPLLLHC